METAALLVVLAAVGGFVVVRIVFGDETRAARARTAASAHAQPDEVDQQPAVHPTPEGPRSADSIGKPAGGRRRRLLTAAALTDTLAIEGEEEFRPSFFGRTLAFGRLLLVILFICALAGGTLFWIAMMIASKAHIHPS